MFSFGTSVEASVVGNTPLALVVPEIAPKLLLEPLPDSVTAVPATELPWASSTVTVSRVVETPSAVTVGKLATMLEVVAEGPPATKLTEMCSCTLPSVAVMVSFCACVEASVVVKTPVALAAPHQAPELLLYPLPHGVNTVPATP